MLTDQSNQYKLGRIQPVFIPTCQANEFLAVVSLEEEGTMRKIVLALFLLVLFWPSPVSADAVVRVYYAGPEGGISRAIRLNPGFQIAQDIGEADVFVLNGTITNAIEIRRRVEQGAGLVLFLGPELTESAAGDLLGEPIHFLVQTTPVSLTTTGNNSDPISAEIFWTSSTQLRERFKTDAPGFSPLVVGYEDDSLILGNQSIGKGHAYLFTAFINGSNTSFQEWAYFNYLIYHLVQRSAGQTPLSFADYPGSPVPHRYDQIVLFTILGGLLVCAGSAFFLVRRYSLAHPEALDTLVSNKSGFSAHEAGTGWEEVGFHRPLGGFFVALFFGLVLFVPLIIYQNLILPVYILPSAQALGIWGRVTQFFNIIWLFFDMGTSMAFIKFISQYRVHDPRKGMQYGQVFVWWQILSGAVQVAIMVGLSSTVMPKTAYAIYAWSVVIHTFIQIPGFYQVLRHALTGLQRFDYAQVLDMGLGVVFPMLAQPVFVMLMVAWGRAHPEYGASMGGLFGMGFAAYAAELLTFLVGLFLYTRLGYNSRLLFLAHFDWATIKSAFRFGVFDMLGSIAWGIGQSVEILITQAYLVNYAEVWGNWVLAQNFVFAFQVLATLFNNLMPSISEAISNGRRILSQYYSAVGYQWGGLISAFLAASLIAVADRFILGASGPEFIRAAAYSTPLILWGAVQYPSWVGDTIQRGTNKPWLVVLMIAFEQSIRIGLAFILVRSLQINALIISYFVALLAKGFIVYFINQRVCYRQRFYYWQSIVAPLAAGLAHYAFLRWLGTLIWRGDQISSMLTLLIAILPSYPVFAFFYGLFGGWETDTLAEVRRAAKLSGFMRPLALVFWAATALGARISPLHNCFKIDIRPAALAEAISLTAERVNLLKEGGEEIPGLAPAPVTLR